MADAVAAVGRRVGPVAGVVAHSLGASAVALAMGAGLEVGRAVLIAPPLEPLRYFRRFTRVVGLPESLFVRAAEQLAAKLNAGFDRLDLRRIAPRMHAPLLVMH